MTERKKKKAYKKVPRSKLKYPSFDVKRAVVNRREELEVDYLDKLSEAEKDWLNRFQEETVMANFQHPGELLDKSDEYRKECYGNNNRRNRDTLVNAKVRGLITRVDSDAHLAHFLDTDQTNYNHAEDHVIEYLDEKKKQSED